MKGEVKLTKYTCDGCGKVFYVNEGVDMPPDGWHGSARHLDSTGGGKSVQWFACSPRCIKNAVVATAAEGRDHE